jgi:pyridoxine 5-phosphate synthase
MEGAAAPLTGGPFDMIRLGVNIDHVATIRQARRGSEPETVTAAVLASLGGADSITVHLREDRRHIQDRDVRLLRPLVPALNLEMSISADIVAMACEIKPNQATLVPERREELTTEGGLDVVTHQQALTGVSKRLRDCGVEVVFFVDPDQRQIETAKLLGARAVEIQTARYSEARTTQTIHNELEALRSCTDFARQIGLHVHMGHGLNYVNVRAITQIHGVEELNIGHSIVARAVLVGMERAVREMKEAMRH